MSSSNHVRRGQSERFSFIELLETRRLLSTGAQPTWNVSFDDPGGTWSAYYADITRDMQAAGQEWGKLFNSGASIEISVGFDPTIQTADGESAVTAYDHTTPDGINVYAEGAASELNTGIDPNGNDPDILINIGVVPGANYLTDYLWFDPDPTSRSTPIPENRVDAMSVFMHEIGHGLAYNGWRDGITGALPGDYESTFDQFVYFSDGYLYFDGPATHAAYGADPAITLGDMFHWGNRPPGPGSDLISQLMNGVEYDYQTRYVISPIDVGVMRDVGIRLDTDPPQVLDKQFLYENSQSVVFKFDENVQTSLNVSDFSLERTDTGQPTQIPNSDLNLAYDRVTNQATITFNDPNHTLPDGDYRITLDGADVKDLAGNSMTSDSSLDFFALGGDANHDHHVDADDYFQIDSGFAKHLTGFSNGDFDYNQAVDADDYFIIDSNYIRLRAAQPALPVTLASDAARHVHHRSKAHTTK